LVDHVFPAVPVRQWVLTLPHQLRYVLARDHALCRAVAGVFVHAVLGSLRRRARQDGVSGDRSGAVAIIQRFGAALNLNVHVHALVLDGVYVEDDCGTLRFHAAPSPVDQEMDRLLGTIERRIRRLLIRRGVAEDVGEAGLDRWHEEAPVLAGVAAASVQGRRRSVSEPEPGPFAMAPRTNFRRSRRRGAGRVMRAATATICTRTSACRRGNGRSSNACAGTGFAHRWRRTVCA
jgi:Putative transposase